VFHQTGKPAKTMNVLIYQILSELICG
jgi:hypothetical protein